MCESDKYQLLHKIRQAVQRPCQFQLLSQPCCRSFTWSKDCVSFCKPKPKSLLFQSASGGIELLLNLLQAILVVIIPSNLPQTNCDEERNPIISATLLYLISWRYTKTEQIGPACTNLLSSAHACHASGLLSQSLENHN